ncbi:Arc family DNA-binding protein [Paracoccus sp. SY]|uniref:Arc family DNA-binding protein n=1 Tax=Paracoccus sp. SY TaxID=1330255 RepID=UPI000CD044FF|nr:Arc family DNA-binding protein [Paracoccus sp. SY]
MTSRESDKFMLRLPDGWREAIKARAAINRRTMTQEILTALESVVGEAAGGKLAGEAPAAGNENAAFERGAV